MDFNIAIPLERPDINSYNNVNTRIMLIAIPLPHASSLRFASHCRIYRKIHWSRILFFLNVAGNPSPGDQSMERHEEPRRQQPTLNGPLWV